jgi:hypothetical protein
MNGISEISSKVSIYTGGPVHWPDAISNLADSKDWCEITPLW